MKPHINNSLRVYLYAIIHISYRIPVLYAAAGDRGSTPSRSFFRENAMLITLFLTFVKIGLFTFGGGYAMLSVIEHICVSQKQWITHDDLVNVTVIAESTPGPIAINCATFVGYRQKGFPGALAATLGVILPSFVIIFLISLFLDRFLEIAWVSNAFKGIRVAVGILIVDVALRMIRKMPKGRLRTAILVSACVIMLLANIFSWKISTIILLLAAALASLSVFLLRSRFSGKGGELP